MDQSSLRGAQCGKRGKSMTDVVCHLSCGCAVERPNMVKTSRRWTCPSHRWAKVTHRTSACVDCGKTVTSGPTSNVKQRCPSCMEQRRKAIVDAYRAKFGRSKSEYYRRRNYKEGLQRRIAASSSAYDCMHRDKCLDEHINEDCLPCLTCENYTAMLTNARYPSPDVLPGSGNTRNSAPGKPEIVVSGRASA